MKSRDAPGDNIEYTKLNKTIQKAMHEDIREYQRRRKLHEAAGAEAAERAPQGQWRS